MAKTDDTDAGVGQKQAKNENHNDFAKKRRPETRNQHIRNKSQKQEKVGNGATNRVSFGKQGNFDGLFICHA